MAEEIADNRLDLLHIQNRVREKLKDHMRYDFSPLQNNLLEEFFRPGRRNMTAWMISTAFRVVVLLESMQVESALYLLDTEEKHLKLGLQQPGGHHPGTTSGADRHIPERPGLQD